MNKSVVVVVAGLALGSSVIQGQEQGATGSQANLVFGVAGSFTGSTQLWNVPNQPVQSDTFNLSRGIDGGLGLMFYGMYFPGKTLGLSGEVFFTGLNYKDECEVVSATDPTTASACSDISGKSRNTASVLVTGGGVFRLKPRGAISPYLRAAVGIAIINRSSVAMSGQTANGVVVVYDDDNPRSVSPAAVLGLGITASSKRGGYQVRIEARDNIIGFDTVTGPARRDGIKPPTQASYQHYFSFVIGFEIVLEKSRGRRY